MFQKTIFQTLKVRIKYNGNLQMKAMQIYKMCKNGFTYGMN